MHFVALALAIVVPSSSFLGKHPLPTLYSDAPADVRAASQARTYFSRTYKGTTWMLQSVTDAPRGTVVHQVQALRGVAIDGTHATALIRENALIYANEEHVPPPTLDTTPTISAALAVNSAREGMLTTAPVLKAVGLPTLLITSLAAQPALVWRVPVASDEPSANWNVDIDAHSGALVRISKSSMELGTAQVHASVEPACEGDAPVIVNMPFVQWSTGHYADKAGEFTPELTSAMAEVQLESPYLTLYDSQTDETPGPWRYKLAPAPAHNDIDLHEASLTQTDAYYSFHTVRQWVQDNARADSAQSRWAQENMSVNVNLPRHCNAYYSPFFDTLNFFSAGEGCIDTARNPLVIYHEYGHALIHHSGNEQSHTTALHEGYADVIASYVSGKPAIRDINPGCTDTLRTCVNTYSYCKIGCDYSGWDEGHSSAQVICGTWWELRERLMKRYGEKLGAHTATRLFLAHLELIGNDMPDTYAAAIAADDDNDGDPSNGTDHSCEINAAYANPDPGAIPHFPELAGMVPCKA